MIHGSRRQVSNAADPSANVDQYSQKKRALPNQEYHLAKAIILSRKRVKKFIDAKLFADPALDLLLDLYVCEVNDISVSTGSACIATGVPITTGLSWVNILRVAGLVEPDYDPSDRRRVFIRLTELGFTSIVSYLRDTLSIMQPCRVPGRVPP